MKSSKDSAMELIFNSLILGIIFLVTARLMMELFLENLNLRNLKQNEAVLPTRYEGIFSGETVQKSIAYTRAKLHFSRKELSFDHLWLFFIIVGGILPGLYNLGLSWLGSGIWGQALLLIGISIILSLPSLPFEYFHQFKLEEKFGFNRSTVKLWITDKIKGFILGLLIGLPLLALLLWIMQALPKSWWFWGFLVFFSFQLLMVVLYPMVILPWFNKLTPLPEGALKDRLMSLAERTGFKASTIQVIDGSKRSSHSNAYFTGFGKFRRIVLYDTLIDQLSEEELEAVLAHEIGHYRLGHIPKLLAMSALSGLGGFFAIYWLTTVDGFIELFGFDGAAAGELVRTVPSLLIFVLLSGFITYWLSPLFNALSRRHEYQADAFAREGVGGPDPLIGALRRLHEKNLSNPLPHPLYSAFHYSHPTLLEREKALRDTTPA
jgi:STE24 endopeptidase